MKRYLLLFAAAACLLAADFAAEGDLWWAHIQFLASDKMEGRNTGSDAYRQAAEYVAAQFERDGLKPAGTSGYMQPVKFETREAGDGVVEPGAGPRRRCEPLQLGADASLSARAHLAPALDAPMVFVGYGLNIPEAHYDELAGLNLRGKIAVYVNAAGPVKADGNLISHYSSAVERWATLHRAGAVGIAAIQNPRMQNPNAAAEGGAAGTQAAAGRAARGGEQDAEQAAEGADRHSRQSCWRIPRCRKPKASPWR